LTSPEFRPLWELVLIRNRVYIKADNASAHELVLVFVVRYCENEMVVQEEFIRAEAGVTRRCLKSNWISPNSIVQFLRAHQYRELVQCKMNAILPVHKLSHPLELLSAKRYATQRRAAFILPDIYLEWAWYHGVPLKTVSKTISKALDLLLCRLRTRRQVVEFERYWSLAAIHLVYVHRQSLVRVILFWANSGKEDGRQALLPLDENPPHFLLSEFIVSERCALGGVGDGINAISL